MKNKYLCICHRKGSFSERWIKYCEDNNILYKLIDCESNNIIIKELDECKGLMWHWGLNDYRTYKFVKQLTIAVEKKGIPIYPNFQTSWHYDDKIGQKYLLEAIEAPLVPTYIFYTKKNAIEWVGSTTYPKVFKLSGGASSVNVKLVKNKKEALNLINKAFSKGFPKIDKKSLFVDKILKLKREHNFSSFLLVIKAFIRFFFPRKTDLLLPREKGYVYFQEFIPGNNYDTRIIIIGNKAVAVRRYNRENDFRASGSGIKEYSPELFDKKLIKMAFDLSKKLGSQSMAYDFIYTNGKPLLVEISYCFIMGEFYDSCPGYWDENLEWHESEVNLQYFIIENFIKEINDKNKS